MPSEKAAADALTQLAARMAVSLDAACRDALLAYCKLLLHWNARINLTATRSLDELIAVHLPDSLAAARRVAGAMRVIDVGSGGGMPALPLALLARESSFELYEPTGKKVAFLRTAVRELGLSDRVRVFDRRLEPTSTSDHDVAMSRATFAPDDWLRLGASLVHPGGRILVFVAGASVEGPSSVVLENADQYQAGSARRQLLVFVRQS